MDGLALNEWGKLRTLYLEQFCPDVKEVYLPTVNKMYGEWAMLNEELSTRREAAIIARDLRSVPGRRVRKKRMKWWLNMIQASIEKDLLESETSIEEKVLSFALYGSLFLQAEKILYVADTFQKRMKRAYGFLAHNGFLNFELMGARGSFNALVSYNSGLATLVVSYISEVPLAFVGGGNHFKIGEPQPLGAITYLEWERLE